MLILIKNGDIYGPEPLGKQDILLAGSHIEKVGEISKKVVGAFSNEVDFIDAKGCIVTPGFIDPHQHLLGGSGEEGFASQTPEISASEIVEAGITTVVGCLGVDTTMKTMAGLLAKAKALKEENLGAYIWSGGYGVPPKSITSDVRDDIMFIEEVIGAGEIAVSDERSTAPDFHQLAKVVHDAYVGGMLSKKAGLTHFHIGDLPKRLQLLRDLIEKDDVKPEWLYPTHVQRSEELMLEAIDLAKQGSYVDIDTVDEDMAEWLGFYLENAGGAPEKLTASSDASVTSPKNLYRQVRECVLKHKMPVETVLPTVTSNTADALKFKDKGRVAEGMSADVLVIEKKNFELREVISRGKRLFKDGSLAFKEAFLKDSNREVRLKGEKGLQSKKSSKAKA